MDHIINLVRQLSGKQKNEASVQLASFTKGLVQAFLVTVTHCRWAG